MNPLYVIFLVTPIILIFIVWYIATLNKINRSSIRVDESLSGIDIALSKRYDVLTQMTEVVKGYMKHEKTTLLELVKLRASMSIGEKNEVSHIMDENTKTINIVIEKYPDLRASDNVKTLQRAIVDVEEHLQAARRLYNANVSSYNQLLVSFPTSSIAKRKGMKKRDFFEAVI